MQDSIKGKKLFLLDMDGTIYLGNQIFDGTLPFLKRIREKGGRYLFLTNNSSKSTDAYLEKLTHMGIDATEEDFVTSTHALIFHLSNGKHYNKIYALGTESFKDQLRAAGFSIVDTVCDGIDCLVMGFDTELTFGKLDDASRLLQNKQIDYIATHPDLVCPTEYGSVPDCGAITEALFYSTGRRPTVVGKPEPLMVHLALQKTGYKAEDAVIIGDRLNTDIASGITAGIAAALVFSGETTPEILSQSPVQPTYIFNDISEIVEYL